MAGKHLLRAIGLAALALIGLGLWTAGPALQEARLAAAFAARQTCACVHIAQRPLDACVADQPGQAAGLRFTQDGPTVRASLMGGVVAASAAYDEGYGCVLN